MLCPACGHEQETGKFCGKCGTALTENQANQSSSGISNEEKVQDSIIENQDSVDMSRENVAIKQEEPAKEKTVDEQLAQSNVNMEVIKEKTMNYWNYVVDYAKQPSKVFNYKQHELLSAIITILIFTFFISLTVFSYLKFFSAEVFYLSSEGIKFFPVIFYTGLFILLTMGIATLCLFLVIKLFGPDYVYPKIITIYGTKLIPMIAITLVALFLTVVRLFTAGNMMLTIIFIFAILAIPLYILGKALQEKTKVLDSFYASVVYVVGFILIYSLFLYVISDTVLGEYSGFLNFL
ncbi:hypothetical protein AB4Y30_13640 [Ornithinibacillus sp. 4-3]|uniref:Zinc ribbon domain-containing protein n=1 Tax=Ornithinibacillus sp. 4-3 TaxID=3231488 RepID=A0AB39HMZ0_9BACI